MESKIQALIQKLDDNNIPATYVATRSEAFEKVMSMIPKGGVVGLGDSLTLREIGVVDALTEGDYTFLNPWAPGVGVEQNIEIKRRALTSDVFVTGTNALTLDGKIVNVDGHGNRVAGMIFGPNKCIIVAGVNKVVKDVDAAIGRIRDIAGPVAARRHVEKHGWKNEIAKLPCTVTGFCNECSSENKVCRCTVIIDGWSPVLHCPVEYQPSVIIVGESLGV